MWARHTVRPFCTARESRRPCLQECHFLRKCSGRWGASECASHCVVSGKMDLLILGCVDLASVKYMQFGTLDGMCTLEESNGTCARARRLSPLSMLRPSGVKQGISSSANVSLSICSPAAVELLPSTSPSLSLFLAIYSSERPNTGRSGSKTLQGLTATPVLSLAHAKPLLVSGSLRSTA